MCSQIMTDWILSIGLKLGLNQFLTDDDLPKLVAGVAGDLSVNPVAIRRADLLRTLQKSFWKTTHESISAGPKTKSFWSDELPERIE